MITPATAMKVTRTYCVRGAQMKYTVWRGVKSGTWYWTTDSNNGTEATQEKAEEAARRWLKDGQ